MTRFTTIGRATLLALFVAGSAFAANLPELFKQAKDEFARGDFQHSLADFDALDKESQKPGNEADRAKLVGVISFYRGANLAALGKKEEATEAFVTFLGMQPNASITSPPYPRDTVKIFEQAQREAAGRSNTVSTAFATFVVPAGWSLPADEQWTQTPVRYLLTPAQKQEYESLTTAAERATFVDRFWKQLDATPATDDNEFRREFERRVAFADTSWSTEKAPGRLSDRAAVFVYLGAPTYAAMGNLRTGDDAMSAMRAGGNGDMNQSLAGGKAVQARGGPAQMPRASSSDNLEQDYNRGVRESWVYRQGRIPKGIAFQEVRYDFITKTGYGSGVLQKDPQPMQMLGQAAAIARANKQLN
jgi:GWxTD domain-containing protein